MGRTLSQRPRRIMLSGMGYRSRWHAARLRVTAFHERLDDAERLARQGVALAGHPALHQLLVICSAEAGVVKEVAS